jgi:hypothetical protein
MDEARQVVTEALMGRLGYSGAVWKPASVAWEAAGEDAAGTGTSEHLNSTAA